MSPPSSFFVPEIDVKINKIVIVAMHCPIFVLPWEPVESCKSATCLNTAYLFLQVSDRMMVIYKKMHEDGIERLVGNNRSGRRQLYDNLADNLLG